MKENIKKKRGGKKFRKKRQRLKITETYKAKNRMKFNQKQFIDEYTGEEYGLLANKKSET